ncbi:MAG: DUF1573 domain-containing protein [Flavobacteriia bacterium]|nr:DUF1573 domain-containing protein [Flavobacteriia bacterium]
MREVQVTETVKTQNPNEAKTPPAQEKAPITFSKETIERNEIPYDSQELFVFEFKNTGDTPVLIQNVQTSCGCTTASKPVEPIQPGQKSQISVHYDTKRVGAFTKSITVTTNVSTTPIILTIKGIVLAAPAVEQIEAPKN